VNYKNLILAGLFLPVFGYTQEDVVRLEELRELQGEKGLKIRHLGKLIAEGEEYLRYASSIYWDLVRQTTEKRKKALDILAKENGTKKIKEKELEQIIFDENDLIYRELVNALRGKQEFKHSLLNELFDLEKLATRNAFNPDTFLIIRTALEQELMILVTIEYQKCLQELIEINKEIITLEKNRDTQ